MRAVLASVLIGAASIAPAATAPRFELITGDDTLVTRRIADDLHRRLAPLSSLPAGGPRKKICVPVGPVARRAAMARSADCVVISAYTSSPVWRSIAGQATHEWMTAIHAEPAPGDQLQLVGLLYKRAVRVAAIVGADTAHLKPVLSEGADVHEIAAGDDINRILNRIAKSEVLLATPDGAVYNPENFRNILLSSYRHNQAVIGFSSDMVKSGALASTYSDIGDINAQVAEMARAYIDTGALPQPQFPRYFRAIVNDAVARSLNVRVDAEARQFARRPDREAP
ncbi:MAG: hypothetical protein ACXWVF_06815 [Telluria sp.]